MVEKHSDSDANWSGWPTAKVVNGTATTAGSTAATLVSDD
jgi:hypothetical protein